MIIIDASALSKYILKEPNWLDVEKYLVDAKSVDHVVKEVSNAIWKAYIRNIISKEDATEKLNALLNLIGINIILVNELEIIEEAIKVAFDENITIYDALYIVLAEKENCALVTCNKKQAKIYKKRGGTVYFID